MSEEKRLPFAGYQLLNKRIKEYGVIIKMRLLQKSFHMVLFVLNAYVVLNFKSMGEILWWEYGRFVSLQSRFATSRLAAQ